MHVTQVAIRPTEASNLAERPSLTPELLAAIGARYSRNNEGLSALLEKIDPNNLDKSVDGIFKMVDYGHASIGDMVPVALFIDGVTLWLAYYLWTLAPTAGGQESSTRYIKLDSDWLATADELGFDDVSGTWNATIQQAFDAYRRATEHWERVAESHPDRVRIPEGVPPKAAARMRRNFVFDRARYFLPLAAKTNVMLVMSARAWVTVCQHLLSHPLKEANRCGELIQSELGLSAPRLIKHARRVESLVAGLNTELAAVVSLTATLPYFENTAPDTAHLDLLLPPGPTNFATDLAHHDNRYAYIGEGLRRTAVRFGWDAVAMAEIRDLNRHRTGTKYCPLVPVGFYAATDELPVPSSEYAALAAFGDQCSQAAREQLSTTSDPTYIYTTLLGTQFPFEHTTTADKFLYEAELRTGTGAHYRYAKHLRDALALWYERFPETRGLVLEGSAEPE